MQGRECKLASLPENARLQNVTNLWKEEKLFDAAGTELVPGYNDSILDSHGEGRFGCDGNIDDDVHFISCIIFCFS